MQLKSIQPLALSVPPLFQWDGGEGRISKSKKTWGPKENLLIIKEAVENERKKKTRNK